MIELIGA